MPLLVWDESFSVNNRELDEQHRRWVEIINALYAHLGENGTTGSAGGAVAALTGMMEYARNHFLAEERYMREVGFPDTISHIKVHNEFYGRIAAQLASVENGGWVSADELLQFLKGWLVKHILTEDKKYSVHAAQAGSS